MKKPTSIKLLVFTVLIGLSTGIYCQPQSGEELQKEYADLEKQKADYENRIQIIEKTKEKSSISLEIRKDDNDQLIVVFTKPSWDLTTPEIQLIAKSVFADSTNTYHARILLFTKRDVGNSDKIYIKSASETIKCDRMKEDSNLKSGIIDVCKNWGWCNQSGHGLEGYIYTYFILMQEEDFFNMISSKNITVRFFKIGIPDLVLPVSNVIKLNDLHAYLTSNQKIEKLNSQLRDVLNQLENMQ